MVLCVSASCRNTDCKAFMPLFHCTVNQLLINLVPFIRDALLEFVNTGNLASINLILYGPPDLVINCIQLMSISFLERVWLHDVLLSAIVQFSSPFSADWWCHYQWLRCHKIEKSVWPLNLDFVLDVITWRYYTRDPYTDDNLID